MIERSHGHSSTRRRLRAGLVVAGIAAAIGLTSAPVSAVPTLPDPDDPPPIYDDPMPTFTPPTNGFTWSVPSHFGALNDGIVDYHWDETTATYDPNYVNPTVYPADFDACPSESEEDAESRTVNTYTWTVEISNRTGTLERYGPYHDCHLAHSTFGGFSEQGPHAVTLTVTDPSGHSTDFPQTVTIKDLLIVALGDSYASGEGNPDVPEQYGTDGNFNNYVIVPARWEDRRCHRSAAAPASVAALNIERGDPHTSVTFISFACSGATINTDYDGAANPLDPYQPVVEGSKPQGSGVLGPYLGAEWGNPYVPVDLDVHPAPLPSQIDQLRAALGMATSTQPGGPQTRPIDALMMSAGGNDIGFGPIASMCVLYWDCMNAQVTKVDDGGRETLSSRFLESAGAMPAKYDALATALGQLDVSHTYLTEYPDPTRADDGSYCGSMLEDVVPWWMAPLLAIGAGTVYGEPVPLPPYRIDHDEAEWAGGTVGARLNTEVAKAAEAHGWTLVTGIDDAQGNLFSGHGYCASDSWIRHARDATLLEGPLGQMLPPPDTTRTKGTLHPTADGDAHIAFRILSVVGSDLRSAASSAPPSDPPSFGGGNSDGDTSLVAGANGWVLGGCAVGASCPAVFTVDATDTSGIRGAAFTVNGAAATCPSAAPGLTCTISTTRDASNRVTAQHWRFVASDGIFELGFTVSGLDGQITTFAKEVKVDLDDPTSAAAALTSAAPPTNGWYHGSVQATLTGVDVGPSGIRGVTYTLDGGAAQTVDSGTAITIAGDGTHTLTHRPIDWAGHTGPTSTTTVQIDTAAPQVTCGSADGAWHATDAMITCAALDPSPGSGLSPASDARVVVSTAVPAGTETASALTQARQFCDVAGNCATQAPIAGNKVDEQAPTIVLSAPATGAVYLLGQVVTASYSCADGGSGIASCAGTVANGARLDTSTVGVHQFRVTATDALGHTTTVTATYAVHYRFSGFLPNFVNPPKLNVAVAGLVAPVLFSLTGAQGLAILATGSPVSRPVSCAATNTALGPDVATTALPLVGLTYDRPLDLYVYSWATPRTWAGTCRQLTMTLADGTSHTLLVRFT